MPLALYPMVAESQARGRVAQVYLTVHEQAPFVPSLLKSLAVCPPYLVLAWEQVGPLLAGDELDHAARDLAASVRDAARPPADLEDRRALAAFRAPLGRMLVVAAGLALALDGALTDVAPASGNPPLAAPGVVPAGPPAAPDVDADATFGRIRAALDTPIVNTVWRQLAADDRLDRIWEQLEPQAASTRERADRLCSDATTRAWRLPWRSAADEVALRAAGIEDAAAGMVAILDAYRLTLSRVLTLIAASEHDGDRA